MLTVKKLLVGKKSNLALSLRPDNTVIEALELMSMANIGAVLVMDGGELLGIFSERDYTRKGILKGRKAKSTPLSEVMSTELNAVSPDMTIEQCMQLFTDQFVRHLPVLDDGRVIGILSIGDIVGAIIKEQTAHIDFLEQYITGGKS